MANLTEEIFAVGTWNGIDFTLEDLKLMANAFNSLKDVHQVPLIKLGHNDEQPLTDGQPALGWIEDIFVKGEKLMAKLTDVPDIVAKAISKKLYRNKSVELDIGVEHNGEYYPWVVSGVALLGADIPAVNTLNDLGAYMSKYSYSSISFTKRVTFSLPEEKNRSKSMSGDTDDISVKKQLEAMEAKLAELTEENIALKNEKVEFKAKQRNTEEQERKRLKFEKRKLFETELDDLVKQKKIAPFTRDDMLRDWDQTGDNEEGEKVRDKLEYSLETLKRTIEANPAFFGAEQARREAEQMKFESDKSPDKIVVQRAKKIMVEQGIKDFVRAKEMVLQADSELAEKYAKGRVA